MNVLHRDIVTNHACKAYAAFQNREEVTLKTQKKLYHRLRHCLREVSLETIATGAKVQIFLLNKRTQFTLV